MAQQMAAMIIPSGQYRYELRVQGGLTAVEDARLQPGLLTARRESLPSKATYEVEATLDESGFICRMHLSYRRGPFARSAEYRIIDELMQGSIRALSATSPAQAQLGRFREIDADLLICKALIVAHVRKREQHRWTGRVALIDSTTLLARQVKHTYAQSSERRLTWLFEPAMGEQETLEFDDHGCLLRTRDRRGFEAKLIV
jgi:hypothetical protein